MNVQSKWLLVNYLQGQSGCFEVGLCEVHSQCFTCSRLQAVREAETVLDQKLGDVLLWTCGPGQQQQIH